MATRAPRKPAGRAKGTPPASPATVDPVTAYARSVLDGTIPAGRLLHLACERHLRDLETAHERGLHFDLGAVDRALGFFGFLRHSKGEWAGKPIALEPWQQFIVGSLWGWRRSDGTRRFRTAYNEVPRKNGKSTMAAGIGLLLFIADGEPGAEVYCAATKRDQALIVWEEAMRMVKKSPALSKRVGVFKQNLHILATASKFEPLSSDQDTLDGLNIHGSIVDELHAHKTRGVVDVLETATGARRQPLTFYITTAGFDRTSVCWEQHDYGVKLLEGILEDDTYFVFIAAIDEGDDWTDPAVWAKANPNLGVSVKLDDLQRKCDKAKALPAAQNGFRRLHLDQWTEQAERWMDMSEWDECAAPVNVDALRGRRAYGGLDLASTTDVAALVWVFPPTPDDDLWRVACRFWVPKEGIVRRSREDRVPYDQWARDGFIEATPGNVIDYDTIRKRINEDAERFDVRRQAYRPEDDVPEIAYDRWNASQLVTQLQDDGFTMVPFGQGIVSMAAPVRELEGLVLGRQLAHGGHPVLRWMASNTAAKVDAAGNTKLDKGASSERIDGMVALCMGVGRAILRPAPGSVYDEEELFLL